MASILTVLILIICILLILVVLVQNSKGGGLASGFQATSQQFGARRTSDFLEKATWGLASGLIVLAIMASVIGSDTAGAKKESLAKDGAAETDVPAAPAETPATPPTK